jgi:hypothetical protein
MYNIIYVFPVMKLSLSLSLSRCTSSWVVSSLVLLYSLQTSREPNKNKEEVSKSSVGRRVPTSCGSLPSTYDTTDTRYDDDTFDTSSDDDDDDDDDDEDDNSESLVDDDNTNNCGQPQEH